MENCTELPIALTVKGETWVRVSSVLWCHRVSTLQYPNGLSLEEYQRSGWGVKDVDQGLVEMTVANGVLGKQGSLKSHS